ncbi:MAG: dTDP-4-dehydrorhamnose reductase [Paludibacteraceae bacterium]|nr:dTDP-4-dehydrorhamnose reductase [Paludibacteraceae bacterium]MBN2786694.1 dTDP-4-dehydrorhamnose reductase [Paludibacteraceae bacterium]
MKKLLITGAYGQLGNEMKVISPNYPQFKFIFTDVDSLDICNKIAVNNFVTSNKIDFIINCAAYTAVDKAEEDQDKCYAINRDAVKNLGEAAKANGAKLIHVSTDYVFDGTNHIPYTEEMPICPQSVYGKSKAEGEIELQKVCKEAVIIRTSWLYSSFGNNFVKTMIKLGTERDSLGVIFDQIGTPTYAADLASVIMQIVTQNEWKGGIYHFSNEGVASWYDFTKAIHEIYGISCIVNPLETKEYPSKTPRPAYSVLNKAKIKQAYNLQLPYWKDGLKRCINELKKGV